MFSLCSICRPEREGSGGAASLPATAPTTAPGQQTLGRGLQRAKSEVRVIEVRGPSGALPSFGRSSSMPSGLLAAASRRLAAAQEAEAAAAAAAEAAGSGAVATAIVQAYMQAIKESNAK